MEPRRVVGDVPKYCNFMLCPLKHFLRPTPPPAGSLKFSRHVDRARAFGPLPQIRLCTDTYVGITVRRLYHKGSRPKTSDACVTVKFPRSRETRVIYSETEKIMYTACEMSARLIRLIINVRREDNKHTHTNIYVPI